MKDTVTYPLSAIIDKCIHDLAEQETACAYGCCPICATANLFDAKRELAEAVAKERERCAKVCERSVTAPAGTYQILMAAATKIRKGE